MTRAADGWGRRRRPVPSTCVELADRVGVAAPADEVWERMIDVRGLAGCVPGLVPGSFVQEGPNRFRGQVDVRALGVVARWQMTAELQPSPAERRLRVVLAGEESKLGLHLGGRAELRVTQDEAGAASVDYSGRVEITGRLAVSGEPIVRRFVQHLVSTFVEAVAREVAPVGPRHGPLARLAAWLKRLLGWDGESRFNR